MLGLGVGAGLSALFGIERLSDNADVGDACLFDGIHDGGEGSEGNAFVGAKVDDLMGRVGAGLMETLGEVVDVDGLVAKVDLLVAGHGHHQALLGDLPDGAGPGHGDLDAGLEHWRGEHEDDQQNQHHIDQRRDVDLRHRSLGSPVAGGEGHG
uniref:Uncharacterized protein n=1 Tax=mine drainage metagenome TaxID=410659 RepID=E6QHZ2_9ZZZZ